MRVAVMGGVRSTALLIEKLAQHGFADVHVWAYTPDVTDLVSGWTDLSEVAAQQGYGSTPFVRAADCERELRAFAPTVFFAVGLSQIIPPSMLAIPTSEGVGFHPTALPRGRGRAAIAWLVANCEDGAATFFGLREGVDDGPIFAQVGFEVTETDDASTVEDKLLAAEAEALDEWLPEVLAGTWSGRDQDHSRATWYGRRAPEDGRIDWRLPRDELLRLIRASTNPHPGAFTQAGRSVLRVWKATPDDIPFQGVVGRILDVGPGREILVQSGGGPIRITEWTAEPEGWQPRVGMRLGMDLEGEISVLRARCESLEGRLESLQRLIGQHD